MFDPPTIERIGRCNDGGPGDLSPIARICALGTDCADCGIRDFCYHCPEACKERNEQVPNEACMESMWNDGVCDAECQNSACDFNDCSVTQIIERCMEVQAASGIDYTSNRGLSTEIVLRVYNPSLYIDENINTEVYALNIEFQLTWADPLLFSSPCHEVLPALLTTREGRSNPNRDAFWVPDIAVPQERDRDRAQRLRDVSAVSLAGLPDADGNLLTGLARGHARSTAHRPMDLLQSFNYVRFPFDKQRFEMDIEVVGANISCTSIASQLEAAQLLPPTSSWYRDGSISAAHPRQNGQTALDTCHITIPLSRFSSVYICQSLIPLIIIVLGALLVLQLNPLVPAMANGRYSVLIFAMVLVSLGSGSDLGIGNPTYLIWVDFLKLGQFALLLMAIFENVIVQRLIAHQCTERALRVDRMARNVIPFCIYPIFIGSMVLVGYEHDVAAIVVFFGGCTAVFCLATMAAFSGEWREARARRKFAKKIGPIDLGKEENAHLLEEAFELYDADASGRIDTVEMRRAMQALFPWLSRKERVRVLECATENGLEVDAFVHVVQEQFAKHRRDSQKCVSKSPSMLPTESTLQMSCSSHGGASGEESPPREAKPYVSMDAVEVEVMDATIEVGR